MAESGGNEISPKSEDKGTKRAAEDNDDEDEWIGPLPTEASKSKKAKVLEFESVYLNNLPSAESYEKSYMHRDVLTQLAVTKTGFIVTASCDGFVKFWKKSDGEGIEFVKQFRAHLGNIEDLSASCNGELCATISNDKAMKVFDIVNFDMINMLKLGYVPNCCEWIYAAGDAICAIAVAEKDSTNIHIYDGRADAEALHTIDKMHYKPVNLIRYNPVLELMVTFDTSGMVEYSTGPKFDYKFPKTVSWQFKTDTDLYEFAKKKCKIHAAAFSPCGKKMATTCSDRKVRLFKVVTGKMSKVLDESLEHFSELQQSKQPLPNMEFGRRLAAERELEKSEGYTYSQLCFDPSGHFLLYGTMIGVKVINLYTNKCVRILGKPENARFLQLGLYIGTPRKLNAGVVTVESEASDNPALQNVETDPSLFCTAFKKNRFYIFTRREPFDTKSADSDRDVFNEKPTKEEILSVAQDASYSRVSDNAVIHTTMGDIHCRLFAKECPKTIENFCVHAKNGYYNGHLFHRVIKGFMVQTGDPQGNGTGGESIWGVEFEDEFHPNLRHDRPYTLSMANAGANTNGSQFFITVTPTPWLDNKHTVFGRVTKGMEVIQKISNLKTNPKTDKPHDDVSIVNVLVR